MKNVGLPVGFFPEVKPSGGASASICAGVGAPEVDGGVAAGEGEDAGGGEDEGITG